MIFLHIGAQKTGSTTIQKALYDSRDELKSANLYYADVLPNDPNKVSHYNSVRGFFSNDTVEKENVKTFLSQFEDVSRNYIISAENLSNWPPFKPGATENGDEYIGRKEKIVHAIKEALTPHEVTIILYTRNREDYLKSLFKQHLKVNSEVSRSIDQSLHRFLKRELARSDFEREAENWRSGFERVHLVNYDQFNKTGLLESFASCIDYSGYLRTSEDLNLSPNWNRLEMRRIKNSLGAELKVTDNQKAHKFNVDLERYVSSVITSYISRGMLK